MYETTNAIRCRVDCGPYFSTESIVSPGVMYVLEPDEIAIVSTRGTVRLPIPIAEELCALVEDVRDNLSRGIMRRKT